MSQDKPFPIDAVITWVDGNDPAHKAKMQPYLGKQPEVNAQTIKMRYGQINEIAFSIRSILKFAPFIRKIYVVSDNQIPDFLSDPKQSKKEFEKVHVVDHKVIFKNYPQYLPTFNSRAIASLLCEIPGLSEHFLYFNDDFFLYNKVSVEDFFVKGQPVIRGVWSSFYKDLWYKKMQSFFKGLTNKPKKIQPGYKLGQQTIASALGFKKYFRIDHCVAPMKKSTLEKFYLERPDLLDCNLKYRFRHREQYVVQSLANHLALKEGTAVIKKDLQLIYFQNYKKPLAWIKYKLNKGVKNNKKLFLCMQSLDQCPEEKLAYILPFLDKHYQS